MKVSAKISSGFLFVFLSLLLVGAYSLYSSDSLDKHFKELNEDIVPGSITMLEMSISAKETAHKLIEYIYHGNEDDAAAIRSQIEYLKSIGQDHLLHEIHFGNKEHDAATQLLSKINNFTRTATKIVYMKSQGETLENLMQYDNEKLDTALEILGEQLDVHKGFHLKELAEAKEQVSSLRLRAGTIIISTIAFVLSGTLIAAFFVVRSIVGPLRELKEGIEIVQKGDLNYKVQTNSKDEVGELARAFDEMTENLTKVLVGKQELETEVDERKSAEKQAHQARAMAEEINKKLKVSMERTRLMAQEATYASESKSAFLANMSHEIRTPMNAIMGFSDMLGRQQLTEEQTKTVDVIRQSAQSMLQLINDILDFSKIEAGKLDTEIIDCSLGKLLAGLESLLRPAAIKKGLKFEVLQCEQLPVNIRTDPVRLRQCLINLVNNAIKFTEKGHVYVNVSLMETDADTFIRFDVEDTGIGIAPGKQGHIFESFSQADGTMTRKFGGTGLGLAITKQLVELLGGKLSVTSQEGKGSVFTMTMPTRVDVKSQPTLDKYEFANKADIKDENHELPQFSGNILVAEDSKANQMLILMLLEELGLESTIVEDGRRAVEKALSQSYDLIFMDMHMPEMDGYEATSTLRDKGYTTPVVALTANAMKGDEQKCISAGCNDYLSKPIDHNKLVGILKKYLSPKITEKA